MLRFRATASVGVMMCGGQCCGEEQGRRGTASGQRRAEGLELHPGEGVREGPPEK